MELKVFLIVLGIICCIYQVTSIDVKSLQFLLQKISSELFSNEKKSQPVKISKGISNSTEYYLTYEDTRTCSIYDEEKQIQQNAERKKEIKVTCVREENSTGLHLMQNISDVMGLLAPVGNSTRRSTRQPGNCVVMLFYTKSCPGSAMVAPHYNALARNFPDIKVAAVDSFEHHSLNTEFGVIGVPSILLFFQGRPIIKFNDTSNVNNFIKFIVRHTNLEPISSKNIFVTSEDFEKPLSSKVEKVTDYWLYLAWIFIFVCSGHYFKKPLLGIYTQIAEILKRNWRESEEAQQL